MGVPAFYKWLVGKYPAIVSPAKEQQEDQEDANGEQDEAGSNGGGGYHNLYLDMNGIIHPCFHPEPEDQDQVCPPATLDDVFHSMFDYMDHLFNIVRPTRLLYLAVDGVAPRAKMNQQRARRFKSAKAAKDAEIEENLLRDKFRAQGKEVLPREPATEVSDPNVITPGTEFMEKLSQALQYYTRVRLNTHPGWKNIKVILSDANVPGEGEHKIMSFIRAQRGMETYDPNTRHCLYGLDADLIMLALASHEVHFSILREDVYHSPIQEVKSIHITQNFFTPQEEAKFKCRGWFNQLTETSPKIKSPKKPYEFVNIWVLREYLELEMVNAELKVDIERIVDDFVFICFLTGNDFIPHIPSLEAHEYAVDLLIEVYKTTFQKMEGYIVDTEKIKDKHAAYLKVSRLEKFCHELSLFEEKIFLKRIQLKEDYQRKLQRQAAENEWNQRNYDNAEETPGDPVLIAKSFPTPGSVSTCSYDKSEITNNTLELRQNLKDVLLNKQDLTKNGAAKHDRVRLGLSGWKPRFYKEKFGAETTNEIGKLQNDMVQKYLEGLCWVLQYYFADVPSWSWYYPFYYAPFASDLKGLSRFKISFTVDKPLKPFDQLMAVLPPESSFALPKCYSKLMDCEESAIQTYYSSELEIDTDGKRFLWQGIAKLPFIDEKLLLSSTKAVEKELAVHEVRRNIVRQEKIFLRNSSALSSNAAFLDTSNCLLHMIPIDSATSEIGGWLSPDNDDSSSNGLFCSPIENLQDIIHDQTISAIFHNPDAVMKFPRLLDNVRIPDKTLTEADISKRPLWHTHPFPHPPRGIHNYSEQSYRPHRRVVSCKPETPCWKPSTPALPLEEFRSAGTGWAGRGKGSVSVSVAAPAVALQMQQQQHARSAGGYGRGRGGGSAAAAAGGAYFQTHTQQQCWSGGGGGYAAQGRAGGGSRSCDGDGGAYSFRPWGAWAAGGLGCGRGGAHGGHGGAHGGHGGGAGAFQRQQMVWRPVGSNGRGGDDGGGGNGAGRGESGQPRAW